jgi:hypothetical protein
MLVFALTKTRSFKHDVCTHFYLEGYNVLTAWTRSVRTDVTAQPLAVRYPLPLAVLARSF